LPCAVAGCANHAVSFRNVCYGHIEDKEAYRKELFSYLEKEEKFIGLNLANVPLEGLELNGKVFLLVDFNGARIRNVVTRNLLLHMCFYDYAVFENCKTLDTKYTNCVFAGARFSDTLFEGSNMLQNNFNNSVMRNVMFNESDLYNSRFLAGDLEDSGFRDCNLKNVDFRRSIRRNVTFKYSNPEDAIFDEKEMP
ncbi:MAG: pentapeptide repeat-containing protein, partial [Spirochaetia bacterium]|nr:pentapeptide repeat-containing protein [Spirochaetia bacterium]